MSTWSISWVHVVWGGSHGLEGGLTPSPPKVRSVNWSISWVHVVWDGSHGLEGGLTTSLPSVRAEANEGECGVGGSHGLERACSQIQDLEGLIFGIR